jgi:tetratricopeptide (TPR) repeat protein
MQHKMFDEALSDCNKAIELKAGNASAYQLRAIAQINLQHWDAAISDCTIALNSNSTVPGMEAGLYNNRAIAYAKKKQLPLAMRDALKALALRPNEPNYLESVGELCYKSHFYDRAIDYLDNAIKADGRAGEAFYFRALSEIALGKKEPAAQDFKRASELGYRPGELYMKALR